MSLLLVRTYAVSWELKKNGVRSRYNIVRQRRATKSRRLNSLPAGPYRVTNEKERRKHVSVPFRELHFTRKKNVGTSRSSITEIRVVRQILAKTGSLA